jgi:O-antigen/teichoic acid export membrane protein
LAHHIRELTKQSLIYGVSGAALQLVGVITLPVFARAFSRPDFGVLEIATTGSAVALALADAGLGSATQRSFFDYTDEQPNERRAAITTGLATTNVLACSLGLLLVLTRNSTSQWLFGSHHGSLLVLVGASIPAITLATFIRDVMRLRFRAWQYVISAVVGAVIAAAVGIAWVIARNPGPIAVFGGLVVGNLVAGVYGLWVIRHETTRRFSTYELRRMLAFGLPLVPTALAVWALWFLDRVMLAKLGNLEQVGEYGVANRVAGVLFLGVTAFSLAFSPYFMSLYADPETEEQPVVARTLTYVVLVLAIGGVILTLFAREIIDLVAPKYSTAYEAVGPLALGIVFFGIASVVIIGISIRRRTIYFALIYGCAAIFNALLNVVLIPRIEMIGAALATMAAFGLLAVFLYLVAQRLYPVPYDLRDLTIVLVTGTLAGVVGVIRFSSLPAEIGVKLVVLAAFLGALRATGVLSPAVIEGGRALFSSIAPETSIAEVRGHPSARTARPPEASDQE